MHEAQEKPEPKPVVGGAKPSCKGRTKAGKPCASTVLVDGKHCAFHAPGGLDPVETGRKGGLRSAVSRRAPEKNGQGGTRHGREVLREIYESDEEFRAKVKASYEDGLTAMKTCSACGGIMPDHRIRLAAGDSLLAQIYGKPQQNVQTKGEVTITVVSRLLAALEEDDVVDVEAEEVRELPPPEAAQ